MNEAKALAAAILAKKRAKAKTDDEFLTDEFQTELSAQRMPSDPEHEIEGMGDEREKMKTLIRKVFAGLT